MKTFKEKYFDNNNQKANVESMLNGYEEIISKHKPNKRAFVLARTIKMLPLVAIWLLFDIIGITLLATSGIFEGAPILILFLGVFFVIHLIPVWIWLGKLFQAMKQVKHEEYVLTSERVFVKSGDQAVNIIPIKYTEIISVSVDRSYTDKMLGVGDIHLITPYQEAILHDLPDYEEVATAIHQHSVVEYEKQRSEEYSEE